MKTIYLIFVILFLCHCSQRKSTSTNNNPIKIRSFNSSFESVNDFSGFYITPQNTTNSSHELSTEHIHSGTYAHKGWIYGVNDPSTVNINNNHRAYPTIQLYKSSGGAFKTPSLIEFWVWLDVKLTTGQWFSFATLDHTTSDVWDAVLINLSDQGFVHLMHVPLVGQGIRKFQTSTIKFPFQTWVKLSIEIHFDPTNGYAKVWQNDELVSYAEVKRGNGFLTQAHFGLYGPPDLSSGTIYNDDLVIKENTTKN